MTKYKVVPKKKFARGGGSRNRPYGSRVGVGSAVGWTSTPESKARRQVKVACKQLVYSCFYIVAIEATRLQEVSYIIIYSPKYPT